MKDLASRRSKQWPVPITSNTSSLPEVVGDAAMLVNPNSVEEIAAAVLSVRDPNQIERQRVITRGFERAELFSGGKRSSRL